MQVGFEGVNWPGVAAQYGILGITTYVLFRFAQQTVRATNERAERLESQLFQRNKDFEELLKQVLPSIAEVTRTSQEMSSMLIKVSAELAIAQRILQENKK